jgi:hypothetical protein
MMAPMPRLSASRPIVEQSATSASAKKHDENSEQSLGYLSYTALT